MDHIDLSDDSLDDGVYYNPKKRHQIFLESNIYHSENQYLENYGNLLSTVKKDYFMIVVEKSEKKVSIKIFTGYRIRRRGIRWFKVSKNVEYLTFNFDTGDYYYGSLMGYQKKKKTRRILRKNCHSMNPLNLMTHKVRQTLKSSRKLIEYDSLLDCAIESFVSQLSQPNQLRNKKDNILLKSFLDKKNIKYPNNFDLFYNDYDNMVPHKVIKKNNNKIVDAFMDYNQLKGNNIKKALHICENLNINLLKFSHRIFGNENIIKDFDLILKILNYKHFFNFPIYYLNIDYITFSKKELTRIMGFFKNEVLEENIDIYTFVDHIGMYIRLKDYGEESLRWKSLDQGDFREEHLDWTDKLEYYTRGKYYRIYPKFLSEWVSKQIPNNEEIYFPILLDFSDDYNRESLIQSNCVKTYIGRPESIIISLRKGSVESEDRATVQYIVEYDTKSNTIRSRRGQSLGKFNKTLSSEWNQVLSKLDDRLSLFVKEPLFDTVKIKKVCSNGREMFSDSHWDENGQLRWSYKNIE